MVEVIRAGSLTLSVVVMVEMRCYRKYAEEEPCETQSTAAAINCSATW